MIKKTVFAFMAVMSVHNAFGMGGPVPGFITPPAQAQGSDQNIQREQYGKQGLRHKEYKAKENEVIRRANYIIKAENPYRAATGQVLMTIEEAMNIARDEMESE